MLKQKQQSNGFLLFQDGLIIAASIAVAILLIQTQALARVLTASEQLGYIGSFFTGTFFTSVFTTAPAIVTLGEIARATSPLQTAFFGALGAVTGDLIIFHFIRDRFSEHMMRMIGRSRRRQFRQILHRSSFRWLTFLLGGLIIASPLPDEIGISLLGVSHLNTWRFLPASFAFNFIGIYLIGEVARQL